MLDAKTEEKLERLRDLKQQRDAIDDEIREILGTYVQRAKPTEKAKTKGGKRVCGICKKPGHNAKTCSEVRQPGDDSTGAQVSETTKVRALIREGNDDETIASRTGIKPRVIAFVRKQMKGRGEI